MLIPVVFEDSSSLWLKIATGTRAGFEHITSGLDHLLFLLTLLLPATSIARSGKWISDRSWRDSIIQTLKVASAFTLGHSFSLTLSALGWMALPTRPVEILIALSIAVTAIHVMRPFPIKFFLLIPFFFGIIHGLAFAQLLKNLLLFQSDLPIALVSFNFGIEMGQFLIILATLPILFMISKFTFFPRLRIGIACVVLVLAELWIGERAFNLKNPATPLVIFLTKELYFELAVCVVLALVLRLREKNRSE